ncbi:PREDICTED: E3 ubiquitin-protein ligase RNF149 [Gavialis gangeticus]|uniref:E3 ubiquitin-protein ligase RNF149 n=1 Tax=Gavialis gangeticus TaxID=94835 RepID=UPI00092E6C20|nr:PREDICTED: E3 ubiquitin-protein ligase RNF149 [Gavialis gangeticus]
MQHSAERISSHVEQTRLINSGVSHHEKGCAAGTDYDVPQPPRPAAALEPPWIALVARGGCTFKDKVTNAARRRAAAVVIYNEPRFGNATVSMSHLGTGNTVVIMVGYPKGIEILEPVRRGIPVKMTIGVGTRHVQEFISGQSVVFVAIAFITMMIISLAWLIFYYIQRFLYTGSQFGNQGYRKETKKVISQLQLHTVKRGDKGLDVDAENCAVCIENYKPKDTVRILPCKHIFHRICIDPWLVDHRTCPMCKLDVIKALGYWPGWLLFTYFIMKGDPEDAFEVPIPESISGSVSLGSLSIALQEDGRNEVCGLHGFNFTICQLGIDKSAILESRLVVLRVPSIICGCHERLSAANFNVCRLVTPGIPQTPCSPVTFVLRGKGVSGWFPDSSLDMDGSNSRHGEHLSNGNSH